MIAQLGPGYHIEIETNGTVAPHPSLDALVQQYNVSPKLAHSGNPADLALIPERLAAWAQDPRALFKFVVATPDNIKEISDIAQTFAIVPERLFVMPRWQIACGIDRLALPADFKVQLDAVCVGVAHLGDLLALAHRLVFLDQQ
eukprot:gene25711-biopygen24615